MCLVTMKNCILFTGDQQGPARSTGISLVVVVVVVVVVLIIIIIIMIIIIVRGGFFYAP